VSVPDHIRRALFFCLLENRRPCFPGPLSAPSTYPLARFVLLATHDLNVSGTLLFTPSFPLMPPDSSWRPETRSPDSVFSPFSYAFRESVPFPPPYPRHPLTYGLPLYYRFSENVATGSCCPEVSSLPSSFDFDLDFLFGGVGVFFLSFASVFRPPQYATLRGVRIVLELPPAYVYRRAASGFP